MAYVFIYHERQKPLREILTFDTKRYAFLDAQLFPHGDSACWVLSEESY